MINPTTGKTNEQVLAESNAVAERAAAMLGGTWEQGYKKDDGSVGGGFTPKQTGIVSSGSVSVDKNAQDAINEAGNRLTASNIPSPYQGDSSYISNYNNMTQAGMGALTDAFQQNMQMLEMSKKSLDMTYNANLASMNHQYGQLFQQMSQQHEKMVQVAEFNAQSLNPYSQAAGAQTTANFTGEITRRYQQQSMALQQQADAAQRQLQAGHFESYVALQKNMAEQQQAFQQGMLGFMMDNMKEVESARRFDEQEKRANIGQYVDFLSEPLPTPQEIEAMSDRELLQLTAVQQGLRSGYDINGIREDLLNASNMQLQQQAIATEEREADAAYRKAQIDNIYDQIRSRRLGDSKTGTEKESPLTWNQFITMRMQQEGQTFTPQRIEQERNIFFTLYKEKGMETYGEEDLPGSIRSSIMADLRTASEKGDEVTLERLSEMYPEVSGEVLNNMLLNTDVYTEPVEATEAWWSRFSPRGAQ